ncbi:tumor necrosis factor receptor superfamily member 8-like, partial [Hyaena hyaena]|uniref:tumor necrosis factor receptor superfamily member 8-like n=1 Tax=Hyaena hyaena TaxID=95912 RepID=UPI001920F97F
MVVNKGTLPILHLPRPGSTGLKPPLAHQKSNSKETGNFPPTRQVTAACSLCPGRSVSTRFTLLPCVVGAGSSLGRPAHLRVSQAGLGCSGSRDLGLPSSCGLTPHRPCFPGSPDCRKQCEPDYYLDRNGRCTACVSCSRDDLVEKMPCSGNSSRVCECRTGMFCALPVTNTCARCIPHTVCPQGLIVKVQGTAQRDTLCGQPSPVSSPERCTSPEDCQ